MEVTSEILPSFEPDNSGSPTLNKNYVLSKFRVEVPFVGNGTISKPTVDTDGDYLLNRTRIQAEKNIVLEHSVSTSLELVGQQLWRGALLLTDLVIHLRNELAGTTVLELGAGVGLTSIAAAAYADTVVATDLDSGDILGLLKRNVERNKKHINGKINVMPLNWLDTDWSDDFKNQVEKATIILAADVIYDDRITEAFLKTITKILSTPPKKTIYIALEKRFVFTLADLDSVAPCFEHFMKCMDNYRCSPPWNGWTISTVPIDFPKTVAYERLKQLIIIKICS